MAAPVKVNLSKARTARKTGHNINAVARPVTTSTSSKHASKFRIK